MLLASILKSYRRISNCAFDLNMNQAYALALRSREREALKTRAEQLRSKQTTVYTEKDREIKLHQDSISSNATAIIQKTEIKSPGGRPLFKIDNFTVKQGDRVCILGLNGTGKSVFIRQVVDELAHYTPGSSQK